jgi:predicted TIM-barrel fold metal-dependent hydrolase
MASTFVTSSEVERIKRRLDHPVVDGDGHLVEFLPRVEELVGEIGGKTLRDRFHRLFYGATRSDPSTYRAFWSAPEENTLDRMTATVPALLYERIEQIGLDFALLFPTTGLKFPSWKDEELRIAGSRALNIYYAESFGEYRDRLAPVAVIPSFSPEEAIRELDFAVGTLGLKAVTLASMVEREGSPGGLPGPWFDTIGHDSLYDYDPVWARCAELGVMPTFHSTTSLGAFTRRSRKNFVYNHIGHFAATAEGICRSLVLGGAPRRFPNVRFCFLEGGMGWAGQLYADLLGHYAKRNKKSVARYDPRRFDLDLAGDLMDEFATGRIRDLREEYLAEKREVMAAPVDHEFGYDDFAEAGIDSPDDIVEVFTRQLFFGCEADDPINGMAFNRGLLPHHVQLNAFMGSDIGHWDVTDMTEVLPEAWELVEDGQITEEDFRSFTFTNIVRALTDMNPQFFDGTPVESAVKAL